MDNRVTEPVVGGGEADGLRRKLRRRTLPDELVPLVTEYETVGGRDRFLWTWVHALSPHFQLPCVDPGAVEENRVLMTELTMFVTLLDDLIDDRGDADTFEAATDIPDPDATVAPDRPGVDGEYLLAAERVWQDLLARLEDAPRRDEFLPLLRADVDRVIDAIRFADTVNRRPGAVTLEALEAHAVHNMAMLAYADLNLMYSPGFDAADLLPTRIVVRRCQRLARIGNWVTTWRRELREGDFTSGVVVAAVEEDVVTPDQLAQIEAGDGATRRRVVDAIEAAGIESRLLRSWRRTYGRAMALAAEPASLDMPSYVSGMEEVLRYHLASRGLK